MTTTTETVLGKRKARTNSIVLHLSPPPSVKPILVNGVLLPHTEKKYACTYHGCQKSYSKPSRLAEHERSHTGDRPFVCEHCDKSYLRETHLQAHTRSHLPESARPLVCSQDGCAKRFWTSQHLRVHIDWHNGSTPFQCPEDGCDEAFAKNNQLRAHICQAHLPPGSKPYVCEQEGCAKTFSTSQHLRTHSKVHDQRRYTCIHPTCLPGPGSEPIYFSNWTALQHHIRTVHQPTCTHPSCDGRTFSSQKGLGAHLKLHEQRDLEMKMIHAVIPNPSDDDDDAPLKTRRGGEIGRDWKCDMEGCDKDFKSKKALTTHHNVTHLGRRDYVCPKEGCQQAFGYKHLLQRHLAKVHTPSAPPSSDESETSTERPEPRSSFLAIDLITGKSYAQKAQARIANATALMCPYPHVGEMILSETPSVAEITTNQRSERNCDYAFSRAYDLRRHLKTTHGLHADKESVDQWVKGRKKKCAEGCVT